MRRYVLASVAALLTLGAAPGSAAAASVDAAGTTVVAFSDTNMSPFPSTTTGDLSLMKSEYCSQKGHGKKISMKAAIREADHLVNADSHGRGLKAFSRSADGRTETKSLESAAGGLAAGKSAAALAGLVRAHQLAPHDPVPLIDGAALLSEAGQAGAALAFLDRADGLKAPKTHPFGISWKAIAANNRGQALIVAGEYGAAEKELSSALKMAPLLREAEQNLALAYDCDGKGHQASNMLFLAVHRQRFADGDYVEKGPDDPTGQLNFAEVLDTSRGQTLTLPSLVFPQTMDDGVEQRDANFKLQEEIGQNQLTPLTERINSDQSAVSADLAHVNPATAQRTRQIIGAPAYAAFEPRLRSMYNRALGLQTQMGQLQLQGENQGGCANAGLHGQWLSLLKAYDTAQNKYAGAEYKLDTALAANLRNPDAHRLMIDQARENALNNFTLIVEEAGFLDSYDAVCDPNHPQGTFGVDKGQTKTPASPACPTGITGPGFTLNLLILSFSVTCEEVKSRITLGEGWLNLFVSVSQNFRTGTRTIFAGPQLGATIKAGPFEGGATARGGVYVTYGSDGSVQDLGVRAETSAGVKISGVGASLSGVSPQYGLAGAFAPPM